MQFNIVRSAEITVADQKNGLISDELERKKKLICFVAFLFASRVTLNVISLSIDFGTRHERETMGLRGYGALGFCHAMRSQ